MEENNIEELLKQPFSRLNFQEKQDILKRGRPCSVLPKLLTLYNGKKVSQYNSFQWLAGCNNSNRLWNRSGFYDLNRICVKLNKNTRKPSFI